MKQGEGGQIEALTLPVPAPHPLVPPLIVPLPLLPLWHIPLL